MKNSMKNILVAEDEEFNFLYIEVLLANENYNLIRAYNGEEAVEIVKTNSQIDLILMDIKMPKMNGFEATKIIKKLKPDLPVVAQSAYSTSNNKNEAFECGCSEFISKPFSKELLLETIKFYIG